jgi:hypothetical protein
MMSRKDFKAIAEITRKYNLLNHDNLKLYEMTQELCSYFKKANPTFDKGKYLKACGWYQE